MSLVCRICLRPCGALVVITRNILPRYHQDASDEIMQFYEFLYEVLVQNDSIFFQKMCRKCLNTIRDMYTLLDRCVKSTIILKEMKNLSIKVRNLTDEYLDSINVKRPLIVEKEETEDSETDTSEYEPPSKRMRVEASKKKCRVADDFDYFDESDDETLALKATKLLASVDKKESSDNENSDTTKAANNENSTVSGEANNENSTASKATNNENLTASGEANNKDETASEAANNKNEEKIITRKCLLCRRTFSNDAFGTHVADHIEKPREFFNDITNERKKCPKCPLTFRRITMLGDHMRVMHKMSTATGYDPLKCEICLKTCKSLELFMEHRNKHPESEQYQCRICSKEGIKTGEFVRHLKFHLNCEASNTYKCSQCSETFSDLSTMMVHEKVIHTKRTYACDLCNNKYTTRVGLANHVTARHASNNVTKCTICGLQLLYKEDLDGHMKGFKEHLKCDQCHLKFTNQKDVDAHKLFHRGGQNSCSDCQLAFHATFILQRHMDMHKMLPFQCPYCKRYLRTESSFKHHLAEHQESGDKMPPPSTQTATSNEASQNESSSADAANISQSDACSSNINTPETATQSVHNQQQTEVSTNSQESIRVSTSFNYIVTADSGTSSKRTVLSPSTRTKDSTERKTLPKILPKTQTTTPKSTTKQTSSTRYKPKPASRKKVAHPVKDTIPSLVPISQRNQPTIDTRISVIQNLHNIEQDIISLMGDNILIREIKADEARRRNKPAMANTNIGMNVMGGNVVLNNSTVQIPVTSNVVFTNNTLTFQDTQVPAIYQNNINMPAIVTQPLLMCNVQASPVPGSMYLQPPLTAVDYVCGQPVATLPVITPNFPQNNTPNFTQSIIPNFPQNNTQNFIQNNTPNFIQNNPPNYIQNNPPNFIQNNPPNFIQNNTQNFIQNNTPNFIQNNTSNFIQNNTQNFIQNNTPNFTPNDTIFTTNPPQNITQTIPERNQIAKKSTTTLLTNVKNVQNFNNPNENGKKPEITRPRISVRRDLMQIN